MAAMIELDGLTKFYGDFHALRGVSFSIEEGDIFGYIGPNGAGKTTSIKILATLLRPDSGTARIAGHDVIRNPQAIRGLIGYMPDFFGVYDEMTTYEYLDFFAACYNIPGPSRPPIIADVLELTDLGGKRDTNVNGLSRGMKQRLSLARCLIHNPQVLLLDEPASGLDPRARIEIRELLKELGRLGKTILISSHILTELADFCNAVGVIENGTLVKAGRIQDLLREIQQGLIVAIDLAQPDERFEQLAAQFPGLVAVKQVSTRGWHCTVSPEVTDFSLPGFVQYLMQQGFQVERFQEREGTLEELFLQVTRGVVN